MRFTLLCASSALAASLILSACSSDSVSQTIPGGSQSSMGRHSGGPKLVVVGAKYDFTCPRQYYECIHVSKTTPYKQEWCVVYYGSDCKKPYNGIWTWTAPIHGLVRHRLGRLVSTFKPNPHNPTEWTVSESGTVKPSDGKVGHVADFNVCNGHNSCLGPLSIGVITE